jgi:hypothetical protein
MARAVKAALTRPVTVRPKTVDADAGPTLANLSPVPPARGATRPAVRQASRQEVTPRVAERSGERPIIKRQREERNPDSGVRPSVRAAAAPAATAEMFDALRSGTRARVLQSPLAAPAPLAPRAPQAPQAPQADLSHPLTYSFYTVSQLHLQPRARAPMPPTTRAVRFHDLVRATRDLVRVIDQYARTPAPRLPFMQVTAVARAAWLAEARGLAAQWPLGKIALGIGAFFVSLLLLLLATIAIAELTDDVPRARRTTTAVAAPPAPETHAVTPPHVEPSAPAELAEPPPLEIDELDDVTKPAPAKTQRAAAAKPKKPFDRFLP